MATRKKVGGVLDNITTLVTLAAVGIGGYYLYNLFKNAGGLIKNIFSVTGGGTLVQTPIGPLGIASDMPNVPANTPAGSEPVMLSNIAALTWLTTYYNNRGNPPTDCFCNALYLAVPTNVQIGAGDAQNLFALLHAQAGTWFTDGDFTGILPAFQAVVANQTDVSYVASLFQTANNMDLFTYITQGSTFGNGLNPAANNLTLVQQFVQWALALPTSGTEQ
jgi:hypothetical protein